MRAASIFALLCLSAAAQTCAAQTPAKPYDFSGPPKPNFTVSGPVGDAPAGSPRAAKPAKQAAVPRALKSQAAAPAPDPYGNARKAQADYFKRQEAEQEKAKLKEGTESRFYKDAPNAPSGNGQVLQTPALKF